MERDKNGKARPDTTYFTDGIADAMREEDRWILWKVATRDGAWAKVPCHADGRNASVTDRSAWLSWSEADAAATANGLGIGFVLGDGWVGVDLDKVASDRVLVGPDAEWIREWVRGTRTWCEWSPSGTGLHAVFRGVELPAWSQNRRQGTPAEVYADKRFFTVRGTPILWGRDCVADQAAVDAVCSHWLRKDPVAPAQPIEAADGPQDASATDWGLACRMAKAGVPQHIAEMALRSKMEKEGRADKAGRADYIPNTVSKAYAHVPSDHRMEGVKVLDVQPWKMPAVEPPVRPAVVEGLFRKGETANWIGSSKIGKTWLAYTLMAEVLRGGRWCGHRCHTGRVLLVDNELHRETVDWRLWRVAHQKGLDDDALGRLDVACLRGQWAMLEDIEATVRSKERGHWSMIVLDAFYRFLPKGTDENSNSDMTQLYNHLDRIASYAEAAILVVHHATKGSQTGKDIMDMGSGAGAIGRATDAQVAFWRHAEDNAVTMQVKCRTASPPPPKVLRVDFSTARVWHDDQLDPEELWMPPKPKVKKKDE
jgi:hypothetical protein